MTELSRDADKMICCLYKEFLSRRKSGLPKQTARRFSDEYYKSDSILSKWLPDDVDDTILELGQKNYLHVYIGGEYELEDSAIVYMEKRFKNGLIEITDFITKFIP
ncbi:MAG: hypothetical protein E7255_08425 [Lachnospiraceae bacterium]|jgi:hypothetical protein|nr:hypothetical protein [Lachnospiraceae bacterium]